MNTKILFEFNIQSITDIITNSSSELFVFKNRELEDLVLILSLIHPCWNLDIMNQYRLIECVMMN